MKYQIADKKPHTTPTGKTMYFLKLSANGETEDCSTFDEIGNVGDYVEGEIKTSEKLDKNGSPYKNFYLPRKTDLLEKRIEELEKAVKLLVQEQRKGKPKEEKELDEALELDDIPF